MTRFARFLAAAASLVLSSSAAAIVLPSNVRVNDPSTDATADDTQSMCSIARLSATALVAAFADSGSTVGGASKFTGYARSTDNGVTWTDRGTLPTSAYGDAADAHLVVHASSGSLFLVTLPYSVSNAMPVIKSTDGGLTFGAPVNAAPGSSLVDYPSLAADNSAVSPFYGSLYLAYREFGAGPGVKFSRSTDGGATWGPSAGLLVGGSQGAKVVVMPNGGIDVFAFAQGTPDSIVVSRSTDGGASFAAPVTAAGLTMSSVNGDLGFAYRTNAFPRAAANPVNGDVYVVFNDTLFDSGDVFFRRSTNGGVTWGGAIRINNDAATHTQFHPAIAVTPDGTHLLIAWYDGRSDASNVKVEYWGVRGTVGLGGVTFGDNFPISNTSWAPVYGADPIVNTKFVTDYDEIDADDSAFDVVWSDGRDDATFSGATRKNMNVRYARVTASSLRGDVDGNSSRDVTDIFALINALFAAGPPPVDTCHGDANHDGSVTVTDVFFLINFLFAGGTAPSPPC